MADEWIPAFAFAGMTDMVSYRAPCILRCSLADAFYERRQELAQDRRPFGVFRAARRMAEIAVELEIARRDPGGVQRLDDRRCDLWREQRVAAAQHIEDLGLDLG